MLGERPGRAFPCLEPRRGDAGAQGEASGALGWYLPCLEPLEGGAGAQGEHWGRLLVSCLEPLRGDPYQPRAKQSGALGWLHCLGSPVRATHAGSGAKAPRAIGEQLISTVFHVSPLQVSYLWNGRSQGSASLHPGLVSAAPPGLMPVRHRADRAAADHSPPRNHNGIESASPGLRRPRRYPGTGHTPRPSTPSGVASSPALSLYSPAPPGRVGLGTTDTRIAVSGALPE